MLDNDVAPCSHKASVSLPWAIVHVLGMIEVARDQEIRLRDLMQRISNTADFRAGQAD